jgi:hypothetical protein
MPIRPHVFEWCNLSSSSTGNPPFTTDSSTARYPITLVRKRAYDIFSGNYGLRINQPPLIKPNQMVVIDKIRCTPHSGCHVQIILETTKYFQNPDGEDFEAYGISGLMSPYPIGSPSTCDGEDALLPAFELDPPIYVLPGQTWGAIFTTLDGVSGVEEGGSTAVARMIRYVLYDGLDAMIGMKLMDMGVSVKPSNIDWYKREILKLNKSQIEEGKSAQDGNIPTYRPQSLSR